MRARFLLACAAAALWVVPVSGLSQEIYRWRDASGEEHFGTNPPPGARAQLWEPDSKQRVIVKPTESTPSAPGSRPARRPNPVGPRLSVPPAETEPSRISGLSESQWRAQAIRLEEKVESLEERIEDARWAPAPAHYSSFSRARWDARQEQKIERMERELEKAEEDLDELEDRARQAGVPPGWLR